MEYILLAWDWLVRLKARWRCVMSVDGELENGCSAVQSMDAHFAGRFCGDRFYRGDLIGTGQPVSFITDD